MHGVAAMHATKLTSLTATLKTRLGRFFTVACPAASISAIRTDGELQLWIFQSVCDVRGENLRP